MTAHSEREARRSLVRNHVCFFAGRIRLGGGSCVTISRITGYAVNKRGLTVGSECGCVSF
ncbi:host cell division inhibitor Icd-like protein [Klebsiella variicola subsp. variicola]|nr:host cell division inhibitor Icd-like protein [Klebsiella variicola subsp. variicola]